MVLPLRRVGRRVNGVELWPMIQNQREVEVGQQISCERVLDPRRRAIWGETNGKIGRELGQEGIEPGLQLLDFRVNAPFLLLPHLHVHTAQSLDIANNAC